MAKGKKKGFNYNRRKEDCTPEEWEKIREYKRIKAVEYRAKHKDAYNKYQRQYTKLHGDKRRQANLKSLAKAERETLIKIFMEREKEYRKMLEEGFIFDDGKHK